MRERQRKPGKRSEEPKWEEKEELEEYRTIIFGYRLWLGEKQGLEQAKNRTFPRCNWM